MLDRLTPAQRHGALLAIAGVLGFLLQHIDLLGLTDAQKAIAAPALTYAIAFVTTLTRQYGKGKTTEIPDDPALGEDNDA